MNRLLLMIALTALALPVAAQLPPVPTAHSPARHGPLHHKKVKKPMSASQKANAARMHQCGQQWKADKAAGKVGEQKWPQYWSACNKRLKG